MNGAQTGNRPENLFLTDLRRKILRYMRLEEGAAAKYRRHWTYPQSRAAIADHESFSSIRFHCARREGKTLQIEAKFFAQWIHGLRVEENRRAS